MVVRYPNDQVATLSVRERGDLSQQCLFVFIFMQIEELLVLDLFALLNLVIDQLLDVVKSNILQGTVSLVS